MRSAAQKCTVSLSRLAMLAAVAFAAASCSSDTSRLSERVFDSNRDRPNAEVTGSTEQKSLPQVSSAPVNSAPLPPPPAAQSSPVASSTVPRPSPTAATNAPVKPVSSEATPPARSQATHTVEAGDTLNKIARRYHVAVAEIAALNHITSHTKLKPGRQLVIPMSRPNNTAPPNAKVESKPKMAKAEGNAHSIAPTQSSPPENKIAEAASPMFRWPVRGRVLAGFGPKPSGQQNDGINFAVPEGTPVKAAEDGVVVYANNELKTYGNLVLIRHSNGFVTAYAHLSEIMVKRDEAIKRGQVIAKAGQTGNVSTPQLHFEIRKGQAAVDPMTYLERSPGT